MTRVCLLGSDDVNLQYELLSRETARNALATYDLREPYENSVALETVSLGAAVALLNDLNWYLVRFVEDVLVLEPSVSDEEWLSRDLAAAVRDDDIPVEDTDRFLKIYGVDDGENGSADDGDDASDADAESDAGAELDAGDASDAGDEEVDAGPTQDRPPKLVEPMFVTRTGPELPDYDLQDVDETLTVRVTKDEFGA